MSKEYEEWLSGKILTYCEEFECAQAFEVGQQSQQAKIDELQARIDKLQKHSLMLRGAAKSRFYNEGEKNILISQADDLDRILKGNKD